MSAARRQVARGVRELAVELLYRVAHAQSGLNGSEETAERIEALQDPRTRKRWAEDAQRLRAHVRRHDALQGPLVAVVGRHAPSALAAVLAIVERAAGLVALEDWRGLNDLEWGIEETELLARLDQELAALASKESAAPTKSRTVAELGDSELSVLRRLVRANRQAVKAADIRSSMPSHLSSEKTVSRALTKLMRRRPRLVERLSKGYYAATEAGQRRAKGR